MTLKQGYAEVANEPHHTTFEGGNGAAQRRRSITKEARKEIDISM